MIRFGNGFVAGGQSVQNLKMSFRYRHRYLVPVVALSAAGIMACTVRALMTGVLDTGDIVMSASCLAGSLAVCLGRRRAYRWLTFRSFSGGERICYWLRIAVLCMCAVLGFLRTVTPLRIIAGICFVLYSVRLRYMLVDIRCSNPYVGPMLQEKRTSV